ncbi:major capsid protein [Vibrio phage 1.081.O._10N.286.52.C2]|nr:major capsid protein [Vibrio phage 1.081.O._10N.286.52.C2]
MNLTEKWKDLLEADGAEMPEIATATKQKIMAKIFENQDNDINRDPMYRDQQLVEAFNSGLTEAVVNGDHGSASNIAQGVTTGAVTNIGPTVMGMVRRAIPQLIAFDIAGVQPMTGPTSQVFTLRSVYGKDPLTGKEAFHPIHQADASFSGQAAASAIALFPVATPAIDGTPYQAQVTTAGGTEDTRYFLALSDTVTLAAEGVMTADEYVAAISSGLVVEVDAGMATSQAELQENFNGSSGNDWNEMSFRIDKQVVEAKSRQLKAQYSIELAQDLRAVHGLDADAELSGILANEVMVELNREIVNLVNSQAQIGKSGWTKGAGAAGVFDFADAVDVKGARWAGEAYKALLIQIEKEANEIGRQTGRGNGNFIIASRNVVSALAMTDTLVGPAAQGLQDGSMNTDTNQTVFAGILGGRFKVYIDQYAVNDYFTVGFKGSTEMDAGVFYSPYVPLTPLRGSDSKNFQPVIGFKTRYGIQVNPFADPDASVQKVGNGAPVAASMQRNAYFRRVFVRGL